MLNLNIDFSNVLQPRGCCVMVPIHPLVAEALAMKGGEPAEDLHITLLYLEDVPDFNLLSHVVSEAAGILKTFKIEIDDYVSRFHNSESDGKDVLKLGVSGAIYPTREYLARKVEEAGMSYSKKYEYNPHITLAYVDPSVPTPTMSNNLRGLDIFADSIEIWNNGIRFSYKLNGDYIQKDINSKRSLTVMKKVITVLKSMRTLNGAEDWKKVFGSKYAEQGELKVVGTEVLKSHYGMELESDFGMPNHVILEQDLTPVVEVIKEGEFGDVIKAMVGAGFMEVGAYGPCMTEKWHELLDKFMSNALKDSLKSAKNDHRFQFTGEVTDEIGEVLKAIGIVTKALEDAEKLANISEAPEDDEFGHDNPEGEAISDSQVKAAEQKMQGHKDLNQVTEVGISDEEVASATQSRDVKKSSHGKEPNEVTQEDVQGTGAPVALDDTGTVKKAIEENLSSEDILHTTFKSLAEAKAWKNPAPELYEVVPTDIHDKRKFGKNKSYIVKERKGYL